MTPQVEIREIAKDEASVFTNFTWEVLAKEFGIPCYTDETFQYFLKKYGAFVNGEIIGSCGIEQRPNESFVRLCYLGVSLEWRSKGIGEKICRKALVFAKEKGFDRCLIDARVKAMSFYEKLKPIHTGNFYSKKTGPHEWLEIDLKKWRI